MKHNKMRLIRISGLSKSFLKGKKNQSILKNFNLTIDEGEFIVLFGPNGCGKTTLLNIVAGIITPDGGEITIAGKRPQEEKIGYIFQNYRDSLLPWKTNIENIAFPLELAGIAKKERLLRAKKLANNLDIKLPLYNFPYQSSGGEQQLASILREVIFSPKLILMDEPFSALDNENRNYLRAKIQEIWKRLELTILFVSHDITEAVQLADRILIMGSDCGSISKEIKIKLPRPRTEEMIHSREFQMLKKRVESLSGGWHEGN